MNLSRGDMNPWVEVGWGGVWGGGTVGEGRGSGRYAPRAGAEISLFVGFCAFLISPWLNTPLTGTLIRLGPCARRACRRQRRAS